MRNQLVRLNRIALREGLIDTGINVAWAATDPGSFVAQHVMDKASEGTHNILAAGGRGLKGAKAKENMKRRQQMQSMGLVPTESGPILFRRKPLREGDDPYDPSEWAKGSVSGGRGKSKKRADLRRPTKKASSQPPDVDPLATAKEEVAPKSKLEFMSDGTYAKPKEPTPGLAAKPKLSPEERGRQEWAQKKHIPGPGDIEDASSPSLWYKARGAAEKVKGAASELHTKFKKAVMGKDYQDTSTVPETPEITPEKRRRANERVAAAGGEAYEPPVKTKFDQRTLRDINSDARKSHASVSGSLGENPNELALHKAHVADTQNYAYQHGEAKADIYHQMKIRQANMAAGVDKNAHAPWITPKVGSNTPAGMPVDELRKEKLRNELSTAKVNAIPKPRQYGHSDNPGAAVPVASRAAQIAGQIAKDKRPRFGFRKTMAMKGAAAYGLYKVGSGLHSLADSINRPPPEVSGYDSVHNYAMQSEKPLRAANLRENAVSWVTRRRLYGNSGRKHPKWKFNWENPSHIKHAKKLSDAKLQKLFASKANMKKAPGVKTATGVIANVFKSNDGKHIYAGKTIGMRQKLITNFSRYGKTLPKHFENMGFSDINQMFKRHMRHGWEKRAYAKATPARKLYVNAVNVWKTMKKLAHGGKKESAVMDEGNFVESVVENAPVTAEICTFLTGEHQSPADCACRDCMIVSRKIRESQTEMRETAASSFGQNLRGGVADSMKPEQFDSATMVDPVIQKLEASTRKGKKKHGLAEFVSRSLWKKV